MPNLEREYMDRMFEALKPHLDTLPIDVRRSVNLAQSVMQKPYATAEELAGELGGRNWVIARRTKRIVEKYGESVICITGEQYDAAQRRAIDKRFG